MGEAFIANLGKEAIFTILSIVGPILVAALITGITISIIQAVTQIQDMTLTFVPKFFIMGFIFFATGHHILGTLQNFTIRLITSISYFTN